MWLQFQLPDTESFMQQQEKGGKKGYGFYRKGLQTTLICKCHFSSAVLSCNPTGLRMTDKEPSGLFLWLSLKCTNLQNTSNV